MRMPWNGVGCDGHSASALLSQLSSDERAAFLLCIRRIIQWSFLFLPSLSADSLLSSFLSLL